jgi:hypothetical protein
MADEFRVHNTTLALQGSTSMERDGLYPKVDLMSVGSSIVSDPLGNRGDVSLVVSVVKGWNSVLPPPDIEGIAQMVREKVTMFSLTGEWDSYRKDNL